MKIQTIAIKTLTIDERSYIDNADKINSLFSEVAFKWFSKYDPELGMIYYMPATVSDQHIEATATRITNAIIFNEESVA
jgi:hypothetical protein